MVDSCIVRGATAYTALRNHHIMPAKLEESKISYLHTNIQIIKAGDDMQLAGWLQVGLGRVILTHGI